ncbi:hypothetical protein Hanom_Chr02g00142691 [Helianthus anomalus]
MNHECIKMHELCVILGYDYMVKQLFLFILQPRFGGMITDIVSGDLQTPEQKSEAVSKVNRTILGIFLIVIIVYRHFIT